MTVVTMLASLLLAVPQQQPTLNMPSLKAPPGYTTKVTTKTTTYDFSKLRRDIILPLDRLPLTGSEIPKGVSMSKVFAPVWAKESARLEEMTVLPSFGIALVIIST